MKILLVEWLDSSGFNGWNSLTSITKTDHHLITSVGFVVKETAECLTLVAHLAREAGKEPHNGSGDMAIPKVAIVKITEMEERCLF